VKVFTSSAFTWANIGELKKNKRKKNISFI